jgi:hypothetical protein
LKEQNPKDIATVFAQFLNVDNLIAESPGIGDMLNRLHIPADSESTDGGLPSI